MGLRSNARPKERKVEIKDAEPGKAGIAVQVSFYVDVPPPTVSWVKPVKNGQVYTVSSGVLEVEFTITDHSGTGIQHIHAWYTNIKDI